MRTSDQSAVDGRSYGVMAGDVPVLRTKPGAGGSALSVRHAIFLAATMAVLGIAGAAQARLGIGPALDKSPQEVAQVLGKPVGAKTYPGYEQFSFKRYRVPGFKGVSVVFEADQAIDWKFTILKKSTPWKTALATVGFNPNGVKLVGRTNLEGVQGLPEGWIAEFREQKGDRDLLFRVKGKNHQ